MIGNIWDRKRGRRHEVGQDRLEQLERLTQLHLKAEYRYPRKDLVALVNCCREAGLGVRLHLSGFARELPQPVRDAGHEILKEALANVIKHGDGRAAVIIGYEPRRLALRVENPVPEGWREARIGRGGLKHMRRCAGLVGGSLSVGPYTHGWQVSATLPIKPASWRT